MGLGELGEQTQFSISMWVNPASSPNGHSILLDCRHGGSTNWVIQSLDYGVTWGWLGRSFSLTFNTWQHLLCTYDNGTVKVYVDGVKVSEGYKLITWGGTEIFLGNWPEGGRRFKGKVDELLITRNILYDADFTPLEVVNDADVPANSLGLWHFDEGSGTETENVVTDATLPIYSWTWSTRPLIDITSQPSTSTVTGGTQTTMSVTATSKSTMSYQWQRNDGTGYANVTNGDEYSGATSSTLTIKSARRSKAGPYRCVVTTAYASLNSNGASLTVTCPCNTP